MIRKGQTDMQNETKLNKKLLLILLVLLLAVMAAFLFLTARKMESYITRNGETNMSAVVEQMEQSYDLQIDNLYTRLQRIDKNLFQDENRSIVLSENKRFLDAMTDDDSEQILFIKENGRVMTTDGTESYLDIQSSSLIKLQEKERLAQSVSWNAGTDKENCYLVAIPCDSYCVDGTEFAAIGVLFARSNIDSLFEVSGYGGQALLFAVDESGIVTYTNQEGDKFYRNYSLLKHMKKEGSLSEQQYSDFRQKTETLGTGVSRIGSGENMYYVGFCPLKTSSDELICMVPVRTLNSSLLEYQSSVIRMIVIGMLVLAALCLSLFYMGSKAASALQKAQFEKETRKIKEEAMAALKVERDRADYANQAKSQFLSNMSHDIRTPMNAIVGFTSLALAHIDDGKDVIRDYLEKISVSSDHLLSLINDVLDMSRIESGKVRIQEGECSLPDIADGLSSILQSSVAAKDLDFHIDTINVTHENIICDKLRVNQILINIASNAIKYTEPGGSVRVRMEEKASAPEGYADFEFSVKDSGIGMSPKFLETLFDPFTRERSTTVSQVEGTGLGMAITKNIVDMMGGSITVESTPGVGSEFVVRLRFRTAENQNTEEKEKAARLDAEQLRGKRVLLADDVELNREIAVAILEEAGIHADTAENGRQAVDMLAQSKPGDYALVLMDVMMPVMDGYQATKEIRALQDERLANIPIIAMTANAFEEDRQAAIAAGMSDHLGKPFQIEKLYEIMGKYL